MERGKFLKLIGGATAYAAAPPFIRSAQAAEPIKPGEKTTWVRISGVYPHLAVFNKGVKNPAQLTKGLAPDMLSGECGIGAVVFWADRLWLITYSPHAPFGSNDKLYSIDRELNLVTHPESVGGTPADRMIHKESGQLIIGPYFIDRSRKVRAIQPAHMPGRLTAVARHLKDPENYVYFYDMEGKLYEADVHTLQAKLLFEKPIPGWHGKGGYTAQNRLILANNGQTAAGKFDPANLKIGGAPQNEEQKGVLAEWDGERWSIVRRRQFTEVTGPGGIDGAPDDQSVAWSLGWDERSVILMLLDQGEWVEWRLPKATHTYDSPNGWYTEWPRIRSVGKGKCLMDMHGMLYDFPLTFSRQNIRGIRAICNHLLMITDFSEWGNEIVFSTDMTSMMLNKLAGQSQSNLWFGSAEDLSGWGPSNGWGGVWMKDNVVAGRSSDPYLIGGFDHRVAHIAHGLDKAVTFTFEIYDGKQWQMLENVSAPPKAYRYHIFRKDLQAEWIRVKTDLDCEATVYFHCSTRGHDPAASQRLFGAVAPAGSDGLHGGLLRPAGYNRNLQFLSHGEKYPEGADAQYYEVDERMRFSAPADGKSAEVQKICAITADYEVDAASVIVHDASGAYRLPKTDAAYERPIVIRTQRGKREVVTERSLLNAHGTFYEIANQTGFSTMRPVCTHKRDITDFCSWRGLLVMSGTREGAAGDGHYFPAGDNTTGLWFGTVDDLWKFGQPVGKGGPWKDADVKAGEVSLPYLMTGYDRKSVSFTSDQDVVISLEVDFDHHGWHLYRDFTVKGGSTVTHEFPEGYSAHWVRCRANATAKLTVEFIYS